MPRPAPHAKQILAWLVAASCAASCAAHADDVTPSPAAPAAPSKLTAGTLLMTDYLYRGLSYSAHQPSVGTYVDAQYGWFYAYTNFNSVKFSTSPAVEVTISTGIRPTLGSFDFDIGAAYYYYPGEIGPDLSNYWEAHATVSHKLTEKLTLGATLAYAPDVWQSGAWGTYAAGAISLDLPTELLPTGVGLDAVRRSRPFGVRPDLERRRRERRRRRASAAGLHQLARRPDVQLQRAQARPQLYRHDALERALLCDDRRSRGARRRRQHRRQSDGTTLGAVRRDVLGDTRLRDQPRAARPIAAG